MNSYTEYAECPMCHYKGECMWLGIAHVLGKTVKVLKCPKCGHRWGLPITLEEFNHYREAGLIDV